MKYYILNINYNGKSEVDYWLDERGMAPVFYDCCTLDQIRNGVGHNIRPQAYTDAKRFVETFDTISNDNIVFSIGNEFVYIFRQAGSLQEIEDNRHKKDLVKFFKIDILRKIKIKDCPLVLVSIKANRFIQAGTFRDLNHDRYLGNTKALEYLINNKTVNVTNYEKYLQCLSSLEFETLIAKYLEEKGLFVPAYKGGFLRNYDLFCRNLGQTNIILGETVIRPNESISIQIKLHLNNDHKKQLDGVDLFFCISSDFEDKKVYDWHYLLENIAPNSSTISWLNNSLYWVEIK